MNNKQIFSIDLSAASETIIIDAAEMNAIDSEGNYLNRQVTGDYENLRLNMGVNDLRVTGNYSTITLENYSRWI